MATLPRIFSRRLNKNLARVFISITCRGLANADTVTHTGQVCTFSIIIIIIIIFNQQDIIRDTFDTTHNNKLQNI